MFGVTLSVFGLFDDFTLLKLAPCFDCIFMLSCFVVFLRFGF